MKEKFIYETPAVKFKDFNVVILAGSGNETPGEGDTSGWY